MTAEFHVGDVVRARQQLNSFRLTFRAGTEFIVKEICGLNVFMVPKDWTDNKSNTGFYTPTYYLEKIS